MKHTLLLFSLFICMQLSFANSSLIEKVLNTEVFSIEEVDIHNNENRLFLNTSFSSPTILNTEEIKQIKELVIYRIDLVYTSFKSSRTFNQRELNKKRLLNLHALIPEVFKNELISWRIIEQTAAKNAKEATAYFHGFIFYIRPAGSKKQTKKEIAYIEKLLNGKTPSYSILPSEDLLEIKTKDKLIDDTITASRKYTSGFSEREAPSFKGGLSALENFLNTNILFRGAGKISVSFTVTKTGKIKDIRAINRGGNVSEIELLNVLKTMPTWNPGKVRGEVEDYSYTLPIVFKKEETKISPELSTSILMHTQPLSSRNKIDKPIKIDSTIFKVFKRNKEWEKMLIICDITSSMSPYSAQLLLWLKSSFKENGSTSEHFTFFNDGDNKIDSEKKLGDVGGIYHCKASVFENIRDVIFTAMMAGYGGDIPENNIEATLEGINQCPSCKEIVMIADNYATPRDLSLWHKVNAPIHIILCGTSGGINVNYLNLAYKTKGSLHTTKKDISFSTELKEGEEISFESNSFVFLDGKFVRK